VVHCVPARGLDDGESGGGFYRLVVDPEWDGGFVGRHIACFGDGVVALGLDLL
jgi:hypothetical protein